ncbi:MAG TPA: hypothetical protein VGC45_06785 [Gryllotalpicola sp.]
MGLLEGKVAFITGGARGQGRAHALASAREGADVSVVDIADQLDAAVFPNSELASAITGVALPVDAGHMILPGVKLNPAKG